MRNLINPIVIVSCFQSRFTVDQNESEHAYLRGTLDAMKVRYIEVDGKYKGTTEKALVLSFDNLNLARQIALSQKQESILIVNNDGSCELEFTLDGNRQHLGHWVDCDAKTAATLDAYTFEPVTQRYFRVI